MNVKDLIRSNLAMSDNLVEAYLGDLSTDDLTLCAVDGMNPIAWQLGHLIVGEKGMVEQAKPGASPELPAGFADLFDQKVGPIAGAKYPTKDEFLAIWKTQREATLAALAATPDEKLSDPTGVSYAPTVAEIFNMVGSHTTMHVGQWVAVRRKLGKPVAM